MVLAVMCAAAVSIGPGMKPRIELGIRKPKVLLGENVLVDFCVVNDGEAPITIDVGGDYRGSSRSLRFKVEVRDAKGTLMPDPDPEPFNLGGLSYSTAIAPGRRWCESLPLWRYARIDRPGTYTVRATHDLGWPAATAPAGTATLSFSMPTLEQAEAVVAAMEALPADPNRSAGKVSVDYSDFAALRYEVYVGPLLRRAREGKEAAIAGLSEIPTAKATRALVSLLGHSNPDLARAAASGLAMRLPDPALEGVLGARNPFENSLSPQRKYLSARAWDPALRDQVRAAARTRLSSGEVRDVVDGAFMLEAVGVAADGPDLVKALDIAIARTRTAPAEQDIYPVPRGACMELLRAATVLVGRGLQPSLAPKSPGEIALWLVALRAGARPAGWDSELSRAMSHTTAYLRQLALEHAPDAIPEALVPAVAADLAHPDPDVVVAAAQLAERARRTSLSADVVRAMAKVTGLRLDIVSNAAYMLGARYERMRALVARLEDKDAFDEALSELVGLLDYHGASRSGEVSGAKRAALAARWRSFVEKHRVAIEADKKVPLDDPSVTPDLLPSTWKLGRGDGREWP
jgi:hypothetical protein